ncbi:hypothetical protein ACFZ8E_02460 [Methylobacterium sp. HMF5984]|uniref:hypothetical protein n=1 Tax=Methylobacterium sp. HMF5984 TaxID=3367370 RepID=UPI0038525F6D
MPETQNTLIKIADILDVPIEAFWNFSRLDDERSERLKDCSELLEAFQMIRDKKLRLQCISYVKSLIS